jgi:hypothetical protein
VKKTPDPIPGWQELGNDEADERGHLVGQAYERYFFDVSNQHRSRWQKLTHWWPWRLSWRVWTEIRLPAPSITYEIGVEFGPSEPPWREPVRDFCEKALEAFRSLTAPDEFIYALDGDYNAFRLWPHRADASERWALGVPGARDWNHHWENFIVPPDFSWVFHADQNYNDERQISGETVTLSGQALLDAFEKHKPRLFVKVAAIDGVEVAE